MRHPRIIILLLTVVVFYSCSKNTGLPGYIKDLEINHTDSVYIGQHIKFYSTAPAGSTYFWTFGTGETSTADSPVYTYLVPRAFTVSLKINDTGTPVTKTVYISIGQNILGQMTVARHWSVHFTGHNPSGVPVDTDTVYNFDGARFAINNDTSLLPIPTGEVLSYIFPGTYLPAGRSITFGNGIINDPSNSWSSAYYDYNSDSMSYTIYSVIPGGYQKYEYTSPH